MHELGGEKKKKKKNGIAKAGKGDRVIMRTKIFII